jgi:hypothetical protein
VEDYPIPLGFTMQIPNSYERHGRKNWYQITPLITYFAPFYKTEA